MHRPPLLLALALGTVVLASPHVGVADSLKLREPLIEGVDYQGVDISRIIYLERCVGGCVIRSGQEDARANTSSILSFTGTSSATISEFDKGDEVWDAMVDCVKTLYAPYDVEVTDVDPGPNLFHHKAIVAGYWQEINYEYPIGGVAPSICFPRNNAISFTFANQMGNPLYICSVVGQETAHAFGLEHAYNCSDPMTYLGACGRQFFRDGAKECGELEVQKTCDCGGSAQNSHGWLNNVLGPNPTPIAGPDIDIALPAAGATVQDGFSVGVTAEHVRGVKRVEIRLNGEPYGWQDGYDYTNASSPYWFDAPADLPDGVIDIEIVASNDLGVESSQIITVTKGSPCASADTCLAGQLCEAGRCLYPPASVDLGGECASARECLSGLCPTSGDESYCSQSCFVGVADQCPSSMDCIAASPDDPSMGVCWPDGTGGGGGGCSTSHNSSNNGGTGGLLLILGVLLAVRRRRS